MCRATGGHTALLRSLGGWHALPPLPLPPPPPPHTCASAALSCIVRWTDWNIVLDHTGGPNHVGNLCFAPVHADTRTGEVVYTPAFYYIGHFSKFLRPGAQRVSTATTRPELLAVTFCHADGRIVTVVMNTGDTEVPFALVVQEVGVAEVVMQPRSMQTLIYSAGGPTAAQSDP